jgi:deoxyribodipyrimidine photo-lyase
MYKPSEGPLKKGVFWFQHDLRLSDNPALITICQQVDVLLCVYVIDPVLFSGDSLLNGTIGEKRWRFLQQSLSSLDKTLREHGQRLIILEGQGLSKIQELLDGFCPQMVASSHHPGVYEGQQWASLESKYRQVHFIQGPTHYLVNAQDLPFALQDLPSSFTPFRKMLEKANVDAPVGSPANFPPMPQIDIVSLDLDDVTTNEIDSEFIGGAQAGLSQLNYYLFDSHQVKEYKHTRNALDGWHNSSKLSAWLANGCLSARQVFSELRDYEQEFVGNESTYWLYFELLWREYFQWYLLKHQAQMFHFAGIKKVKPTTSFEQQPFTDWCEGKTEFPIVNACMAQLNKTGYMSNRGRQLVASCFVHELALDWRYGAAYFEQQLIDYDVASNWGNWQYLAGVGADPRGHRRFDLAKQSNQYDGDGLFRQKWLGSDHRY